MKLQIKRNYWQRDIKKLEYTIGIAKGVGLIVIISQLFYESFIVTILLAPLLIYFFKNWNEEFIKKKKVEFQMQFKDSMQSMIAALRVGYSVENAMKETLKDLKKVYSKQAKIIREYNYMIQQINMNVPVEKVLEEFARRVEQEDVQNFVTVFVMSKRSGGDSVSILKNAIHNICEKIEVNSEIQIIMAAKKMEFQFMTIIPFGIIIYMRLSFSEFMNVLYGNTAGIIIMSVCLALYAGAYQIGKGIIEIEV